LRVLAIHAGQNNLGIRRRGAVTTDNRTTQGAGGGNDVHGQLAWRLTLLSRWAGRFGRAYALHGDGKAQLYRAQKSTDLPDFHESFHFHTLSQKSYTTGSRSLCTLCRPKQCETWHGQLV